MVRVKTRRFRFQVCCAAAIFVGAGAGEVARAQEAADTQDSAFSALCRVVREKYDRPARDSRSGIIPDDETSELRIVPHAMIRLYQEFISSQHYNVCVFEPSCSHFGQETIRTFGLIRGGLLTADRLQRCNMFASQYGYGVDRKSGRLLDPVETYQATARNRDSSVCAESGGTP